MAGCDVMLLLSCDFLNKRKIWPSAHRAEHKEEISVREKTTFTEENKKRKVECHATF